VPANLVVPLKLKDVTLALEATGMAPLALPAANVMRDHLIQALAQGYGNEDWAVIARVIRNALSGRADGRLPWRPAARRCAGFRNGSSGRRERCCR